jgi:Tfp pilus assembly protein PilF
LGFADALVASLGNLQGIDVLPTSSVINLPPDTAPSNLASRLGARFVVQGAIQFAKGQWSLSIQVFDAHLQSTCYSRKRDFALERLSEVEDEIAKQIAVALNRPLGASSTPLRPRYSKDPMAYAEFMRGYRLSSSNDAALLEEAAQRLTNAITRDPNFSLAHAALSFVCASRHFEFDPASAWLEKAEFHCQRALELNPDLPEGHVARAFLIWGPSKNFQHLEAITELKRALSLQKNLPHAYNRLGTILAHIGLLDHAREMLERGRPFHPQGALSHSIVQVYVWGGEHELAHDAIQAWRDESPSNKYALTFDAQLAMITGRHDDAAKRVGEALQLLPEDPLVISMHGVFLAQTGDHDRALDCMAQACANPKAFGHAHHAYYQIACILALTGRHKAGFDWLERSVSTGFACWPFFLKDPCLQNLRSLPEFEVLISALQSKYPDHLGLL